MKSVLVVDDEQALLMAIELILSSEFRVLTAATGEEALLLIRDFKPDLVLMDIMMPGLGGLEALKMMKSHPEFKSVPVIVMSGARPLARQADYGWVYFLDKPFSGNDLLQVVRQFI